MKRRRITAALKAVIFSAFRRKHTLRTTAFWLRVVGLGLHSNLHFVGFEHVPMKGSLLKKEEIETSVEANSINIWVFQIDPSRGWKATFHRFQIIRKHHVIKLQFQVVAGQKIFEFFFDTHSI